MTEPDLARRSILAASAEDIDVERAVRLAGAGAVVLDVREGHEWAAGHLPGAVHLPLGAVTGADLSVFGDRQVVIICRSGNRSGKAAAELRPRGVRVVNVAGGMKAWAAAGLPVVTDAGTPGLVK